MKLSERSRVTVINLLVALAITIFVDFSNILFATTGIYKPRPGTPPNYMLIQMSYIYVVAFILLTINTYRDGRSDGRGYSARKAMYTVFATVVFFLFAPTFSRDLGEWSALVASNKLGSPRFITRFSFVMSVTILYGIIFNLTYQKQKITIENQQLRNENLQTRYNMLISQINPHFLFNSLNSLSMLVRENMNAKALVYIDRMSDTFRYILSSGSSGMTALSQELEFVEAYKYLHEIRYDRKLFVDIEADPAYREWLIPSLSLQPLIENAVKHNTITLSKPLKIKIFTDAEGNLVVSNPIQPKMDSSNGTGIGLANLSSRYKLLTGKEITVSDKDGVFTVTMPLIDPVEA